MHLAIIAKIVLLKPASKGIGKIAKIFISMNHKVSSIRKIKNIDWLQEQSKDGG